MRLLMDQCPIEDVDIRSGHNGLAGVCRSRTAREVADRLETLRRLALKHKRARNDSTRGKRIANRQRIQIAPGHEDNGAQDDPRDA